MLENLGCRVDVAANGNEALHMIELVPYDIVFMDCEMPEMNGFDATTELRRRLAGKPHLPVVAMTAKAIQGDRERCLAAGMDDYISKPVRLEDLAAALNCWTANRPDRAGATPAPDNSRPAKPARVETAPLGPAHPRQTDSAPEESSTQSAPATPVLDPDMTERLQELAASLGPSVLTELYEVFQTSAVESIAALRRAVCEQDPAALRNTAHALKGASANIGATLVSDLARQLEALGHAGSIAGAQPLLAGLDSEFARVQLEIQNPAPAPSPAPEEFDNVKPPPTCEMDTEHVPPGHALS